MSSKRANTPPHAAVCSSGGTQGRPSCDRCAGFIIDTPQSRRAAKSDASAAPLVVRGWQVFRHEHNLRGATNQPILRRMLVRLNQREHSGAVGRRHGNEPLTRLDARIERQLESELVEVKAETALLVSDVHVDRVHAQEGITRRVSR